MQDDINPLTFDDLVAKSKKLNSFSVRLSYQTFISDYDRMGREARTLHVVIKCDDDVREWIEYPIIEEPPDPYTEVFHEESEETISRYVRGVLPKDVTAATVRTVTDAYYISLRDEFTLDALESLERVEGSRSEKALMSHTETLMEAMDEERRRTKEKQERIEQLLADYESALRVWQDIGKRRKRDAGLPIKQRVKAIKAFHEDVPVNLIEEFLRDELKMPAEMALDHLVKLDWSSTVEGAKKAIARAKRKKRDISEKRQMSL